MGLLSEGLAVDICRSRVNPCKKYMAVSINLGPLKGVRFLSRCFWVGIRQV